MGYVKRVSGRSKTIGRWGCPLCPKFNTDDYNDSLVHDLGHQLERVLKKQLPSQRRKDK